MERKIGHQLIIFKDFFSQLDLKIDYDAKIAYLKSDYSAVFIKYCKDHGMKKELENYVAECMQLRDAGV